MQYWRIKLLDNFNKYDDVIEMLNNSGFIEDYEPFRTFPEALDDREFDWTFDNESEYKECLDTLQDTISVFWRFPNTKHKFNNGLQWPMLELVHDDDDWIDDGFEEDQK